MYERCGGNEVLGKDDEVEMSKANKEQELLGHMRAINHVLQMGTSHGISNASRTWEAKELKSMDIP